MAVIKMATSAFAADPLITATLAFYALWLLVTLVQWGLAGMVVANPLNAARRTIFGTVLAATVCLSIADGCRIGQIVVQNSDNDLDENTWITFYGIDAFMRLPGLVLIYLSVFLATYHRIAIYVAPPSQVWFVKKIVDGVLIGLWALLFLVEDAWYLAIYAGYFISGTLSSLDFTSRQSTGQSLDKANGSFLVLVDVAAIVGIVLLNNASNSQRVRDPVVKTLMHVMLPLIAFRAIWTIASLGAVFSPGVIKTQKASESFNLAFAIIDQASLAIMIGIMIRLGFQPAFWETPAGATTQPGPMQHQPYGGQAMIGGQQGMTMLIGPNGLPILGPNGQPMFAPAAPAPGQGPDAEMWKQQSMYSPNPVSAGYQQQNVLPYGQFVPQQQQFIAPQQQQNQFEHLPQPPTGYSYAPPGVNLQAPRSGSQVFESPPQQPLSTLPVGAQQPASFNSPTQPNANVSPAVHQA